MNVILFVIFSSMIGMMIERQFPLKFFPRYETFFPTIPVIMLLRSGLNAMIIVLFLCIHSTFEVVLGSSVFFDAFEIELRSFQSWNPSTAPFIGFKALFN